MTPTSYLGEPGIISWLFTLDHKRVSVLQLGGCALAGLVGIAVALLMQLQLGAGGMPIVGGKVFGRALTLHGIVMLFLVAIPGISGTVGTFLLPLQLGARNVAFPRVHLAGLHLWLAGAVLVVLSMLLGGAHTGWTFTPPLSITGGGSVVPLLLAVIALAASALLRSLVVIVTLHRLRPRGMVWARIPPLGVALYAHSAVQVIAAPVWIFTLLSLLLDRVLHIGLFDPELGGDPMLYVGVFAFLAHATVYSVILPAFGVVAEIVQGLAGRRLFWRRGFDLGMAATAVLLLLGGGQLPVVAFQSPTMTTLLGAATLLTAVPVSWMLLSLVGTLAAGFRRLEAPLLLAMAFVVHVTFGGFLGLALPIPPLGRHLQGTMFVVAQQHYLLVGGVLTALLAGVLFWWPKLSGKVYDERAARWPVAALFFGTHLSLFPLLIAGARGLPRRVGNALPEFHGLVHVALGGSILLVVGLLWLSGLLWMSLRSKRHAADNPWGARSLEWTCPSPPPPHNFDHPPRALEPARS